MRTYVARRAYVASFWVAPINLWDQVQIYVVWFGNKSGSAESSSRYSKAN